MSDELLNPVDPSKQASFSMGNRIRRTIWNVAYSLFFRPSPRPLHEWRSTILRLFGAQVGHGCHVYPKVRIWAPWNLVIGDAAGIADDVNCYSMGVITLGAHCVVSQGVHLCAGTHDYTDPAFRLIATPITIGAKSWVCADAFIGPGVEIGEGAVIGARAVVTRPMPAWTVCAGNPCRSIKPRVIRNSPVSN